MNRAVYIARLASRSSHRAVRSAFAKATADSLRENGERRLVTRIFASWNQINGWLLGLQALEAVALTAPAPT